MQVALVGDGWSQKSEQEVFIDYVKEKSEVAQFGKVLTA